MSIRTPGRLPCDVTPLFLAMYPAAMQGVLSGFCFPLLCHLYSASFHVRRALSCLTSHFITKSSFTTFFVFVWELLSCCCAHLCVSYIFARVWNGWMVSNDETVHESTIPVKSLFDIPYLLHVILSALNHPSPSRFFTTDPELTCTEYIDIIVITYWWLYCHLHNNVCT